MLRCTIELIPGGIETHPGKKVLGVVEIANISELADISNYRVIAFKKPPASNPAQRTVWKTGYVLAFPRKRLGAYDLLYRALGKLVGDRNP